MNEVIPINLVVEDSLSEAVLRTILRHSGRSYTIGVCYNRGGFGYIKKTIKGFNNAAKGTPFLVLTDLDKAECPVALITEWLPEPKHPNLLFRVAVKEVEAWLLAQREEFARYFAISSASIPTDVDLIDDPKQFLINLMRKSRKKNLMRDIVPPSGSIRQQGPNYNEPLISFVEKFWDAGEASLNSPSLKRTVNAVANFNVAWPENSDKVNQDELNN